MDSIKIATLNFKSISNWNLRKVVVVAVVVVVVVVVVFAVVAVVAVLPKVILLQIA